MTQASNTDHDVRAVYVISVAAELVGVHPQTLRNYERSGLLDPSRTQGGSRRFSDADIAQLRRIQQLTSEGHNLEGVRRILDLEREVARLHDEVRRLHAELDERVAEAHRSHLRELVPLRQALVWRPATRRAR